MTAMRFFAALRMHGLLVLLSIIAHHSYCTFETSAQLAKILRTGRWVLSS
jgi:hypothetical protein